MKMPTTYGSRQFAFFFPTHKLPTRKKKANCGYRFSLVATANKMPPQKPKGELVG